MDEPPAEKFRGKVREEMEGILFFCEKEGADELGSFLQQEERRDIVGLFGEIGDEAEEVFIAQARYEEALESGVKEAAEGGDEFFFGSFAAPVEKEEGAETALTGRGRGGEVSEAQPYGKDLFHEAASAHEVPVEIAVHAEGEFFFCGSYLKRSLG